MPTIVLYITFLARRTKLAMIDEQNILSPNLPLNLKKILHFSKNLMSILGEYSFLMYLLLCAEGMGTSLVAQW